MQQLSGTHKATDYADDQKIHGGVQSRAKQENRSINYVLKQLRDINGDSM